jgi:hypothetical protein
VTCSACFNGNGLLTNQEFQYLLGINLTPESYALLKDCLLGFLRRFNMHKSDGSSNNICDAFCSIKKPSKKIRQTLTTKRFLSAKLEKSTNFNTFFRLLEIDYQNLKKIETCFTAWSRSRGTNRYRTFAFKFYNNLLGLNTRTSHFVQNPNRNCTFCTLKGVPIGNDETFKHLFLSCTQTKAWHNQFVSKYFSSVNFDTEEDRVKFFMLGILPNTHTSSELFNDILLSFQYCIWEQKLQKKIPSFATLCNSFQYQINHLILNSKRLLKECEKHDFEICKIFAPRPAMGIIPPAPDGAR